MFVFVKGKAMLFFETWISRYSKTRPEKSLDVHGSPRGVVMIFDD